MKRLKNDYGAANTIEMIVVVIVLWAVLMTFIDVAMYFNNRIVLMNATQNGARIAAVYGGANEKTIASIYGISTDVCGGVPQVKTKNIVSCMIYKDLKFLSEGGTVTTQTASGPQTITKPKSNVFVSVKVKEISCGPDTTNFLGERTFCEVVYSYNGTPGSAIGLMNIFGDSTIRMTSESEVIIDR